MHRRVYNWRTILLTIIGAIILGIGTYSFWSKHEEERKNQINQTVEGPNQIEEIIYKGKLLSNEDGNDWISRRFQRGGAFVVGRLGAAEGCLLNQFRRGIKNIQPCRDPHSSSGIYPETPEMFATFSQIYSDALGKLTNSDAMATFSQNWELPILKPMSSVLMKNRALEPFYFDNPWSKHLTNKTVLFVHAFVSSIKCQMKRSHLLFSNPLVLPQFTAKFVQMPQCLGRRTPHGSYVETLANVKEMIDAAGPFHVAIVAAGGYAMPLAVHCRERHDAVVIAMGGGSQLMFGLKGSRWDKHPVVSRLYNSHWMYPLESDTPSNAETIEDGGPYWGKPEQRLRHCPV